MAQLVTTKEKYGVAVAARIEPQLAHEIAMKAERLGLSMAKMVSMIITSSFHQDDTKSVNDQDMIQQLQNDLVESQDEARLMSIVYKETAAGFIKNIAVSNPEKNELIEIYNDILSNRKSAHGVKS